MECRPKRSSHGQARATRSWPRRGLLLLLAVGTAVSWAAAAEAQQATPRWVVPRTTDGHPDLQGNWTNATLTPVVRPPGLGRVLTGEQVRELEGERAAFIEADLAPSAPDRAPPPVGGQLTGDARWDAGAGAVGGYNQFFIDAGDFVAIYNGEPRSSLIVDPPDGGRPSFTPEAQSRMRQRAELNAQFGQYDNPENRPLAERCLMSFGSNAGPPMMPNYFYNNNYTIVQTADHVVIMTEMVHDARIIRLGTPRPLPPHVRPWMGDSWGRWEGDTLVIETTNIHSGQTLVGGGAGFSPSERARITERLTRAGPNTINYEFTVDDPGTFTRPFSGEVPFNRLDALVYEYACHEGNYAMANVLSGARAQERAGRTEVGR
ncbi:MAG: hypothetical protein FJ207_03165 [Gemmatimonadetes bacterium]|nr:hypothetical protein [Gemmatimonadota bacterium]